MLWKYRCGSLCETQFISVVCGLAVIQKQPRLVDRAFNRASPSHFPELAFQALLQTSASLSVSHLTAPSPSYPLIHCLPFPLPCLSNSKLLLSAPPLLRLHCLPPPNPDAFHVQCRAHPALSACSTLYTGAPYQKPYKSPGFVLPVTHLQALPQIKAIAKPQSC